jgi:hypothetical protein
MIGIGSPIYPDLRLRTGIDLSTWVSHHVSLHTTGGDMGRSSTGQEIIKGANHERTIPISVRATWSTPSPNASGPASKACVEHAPTPALRDRRSVHGPDKSRSDS